MLSKAGAAPAEAEPAIPAPTRRRLLRHWPRAPAHRRADGEVEVVEPSRLQTVIARRMAEAKATIPHFQVQTEVLMDAALALRGAAQARAAIDARRSTT